MNERLDVQDVPPPPAVARRRALGTLGSVGLTLLGACALSGTDDGNGNGTGSGTNDPTDGGPATTTTAADASCSPIPEETAGPFPGDGSNGPDVLSEDGVVRQDIRSSFGSASGTAEGIPLTVTLAVTDTANGCGPLAGAAVYLWHCDAQGRYSMYSQGVTDENYLRGVQVTDDAGMLSVTTILPGCYDGRWPHIHFEVYPDVATATRSGTPIATSQLAVPVAVCEAAYADSRYPNSARNLQRLSLTSDMVFGDDGGVHQLATVTGDPTTGYTAALTVPV